MLFRRVACFAISVLGVSLLSASTPPPPDCSDVPTAISIQRLLNDGKVDELEQLASRSRDCRIETREGLPALDAFYRRLVDVEIESPEGRYKELIRRFESWQRAKPQSPTPHLALAIAYRNYAWKARGRGAASTVSEKGWKLFNERMKVAQAHLRQESVSKDPQAYVELMEELKAGLHPAGTDAKALSLSVFRKGILVDPDYYPLYYENLYCYFAVLALDFQTASELFTGIEATHAEVAWIWKNDIERTDNYDYYRLTALAKRQAIFDVNLQPLLASKGSLTFTLTVRGPDGSLQRDLGYERSMSVEDFRLTKSVEHHVRLLRIPDEYPRGRYLVTMVVRNGASGTEQKWTQEVGETGPAK